ncbi:MULTISPECIES: TetR/AcrR family transcriptional regulator [Pseudomonas]|uniref:TetR/AcrR family transcriptional regulator n=1 Tax=Pseudomonas TaxID=286 RepID=UPI0007620565|nr:MULTISPECIES: TetR/AcrR family transcriptional regulator [Pseudomonas]
MSTACLAQVSGVDVGINIVQAAYEMLASQGFGAMSMRSLSGKVGLQPGSLYYHFSSKQDVLEEVLDGLLGQRLSAWKRRRKPSGSIIHELEDFLAFHISYVRLHPLDTPLLRSEMKHLDKARLERIQELEVAYNQFLIDIIAKGMRQGVFNVPDSEAMASVLLSMLSDSQAGQMLQSSGSEASERWLIELSKRMLGVR